MASPWKIAISSIDSPEFWTKPDPDATTHVSKLLQENHDQHHIVYNERGYHNHIAHHLLTIYALGASPEQLQKAYDGNVGDQRNIILRGQDEAPKDLSDPKVFASLMGKHTSYRDFLVFFQTEMERKGWVNVVLEYLFKGDDRAEDLFGRLFSGLLHPFIHFGFGLEFEQPALVAEALAQACIHSNYLNPLIFAIEDAGREHTGTKKSMVQIIEDIYRDKELKASIRYDDDNKLRDGVLGRAKDRILAHVAQYEVTEANVKQQVAEMMSTVTYYSACAQRPDKAIKFDFILMHHINASIFLTRILRLPWLPTAAKLRLINLKARLDLVQYAARGSPALNLAEITSYKAQQPSDWPELFARATEFADDGHASKMVRALAHADRFCADYDADGERFVVRGGGMWRTVAHMEMDAVEGSDLHYVRDAGFDEAWRHVPPRAEYKI